jgi:hypothetical protein
MNDPLHKKLRISHIKMGANDLIMLSTLHRHHFLLL